MEDQCRGLELTQPLALYSNHSETSIKHFVINLQLTQHTVLGTRISLNGVREHTEVTILQDVHSPVGYIKVYTQK